MNLLDSIDLGGLVLFGVMAYLLYQEEAHGPGYIQRARDWIEGEFGL